MDSSGEVIIYDADLMEAKRYWRALLSSDELSARNLELDYERPRFFHGERDVVGIDLPEDALVELERFTGGSPFLVYTVLTAALKICLHRYTGNSRTVIGSPALKESGIRNAIVAVSVLEGGLSFRQYLARLRQTLLDAYARQRYPIQQLVRDLELKWGENRCPLFDVFIVFREIHAEVTELRNDITLVFNREDGVLRGKVEFSPRLFTRERIVQFSQHFRNILCSGLENVHAPISSLRMLTGEEERRLLEEWAGSGGAPPDAPFVHQLFEEQARRRPDAVALIFEERQVTYGELNARANRLAHYLRSLGVRPEALVGIFLERSPEMICALLGILKAGGAYAPLDPTYPPERLGFMLNDSRAQIVLTQKHLSSRLPANGARVVCLDTDWPTIARESDRNTDSALSPDNAAYLIYTSGSTGPPKGVVARHSSVAAYIKTAGDVFKIDQADRGLQYSPISFDASVEDIFTCLSRGAALALRTDFMLSSTRIFMDTCAEWGVTVLCLPTSYWHELAANIAEEADRFPASIRLVVIGGEKALAGRLLAWQRHLGRRPSVINGYGPTEATIATTLVELPELAESAGRSGAVTIGRPLTSAQMYILDRHMQLAPAGSPGEIYIGGDCLARGYLNYPDVTADKFAPHPFSAAPGARLYSTGDQARYLPDGSLEFIGRIDNQVKIRGFRVEINEVEAALYLNPQIRDVAIVAHEDESGEKRLVAYIVSKEPATPAPADLRQFLLERLPEYMAPARFVFLRSLPMTSNGKVDRKALAPLEKTAMAVTPVESSPPRSQTEMALAALWESILQVDRVGRHDNFFELGGHSLLAARLLWRVRETFQVEIALRDIFEAGTLADLARHIELACLSGQGVAPPPIRAVLRNESLPLSFAQQRLWFLYKLEPDSPSYNIPIAIRMRGRLRIEVLERAFNEIVKRHETLRTTFQTIDGIPAQIISPAIHAPLPLTSIQSLPEPERESEVQGLAIEEARRPFNLEAGPLVRVKLLRLGEEESVLLLTMHHIVCDGWSMGVLVEELAALYGAHLRCEESSLPEAPVQYADYAAWQREWMRGEALEAQLSYWREKLLNIPPPLELPFDRRRPAQRTHRGAVCAFTLGAELSERFRALCRCEGVTLYMGLLAAFQALLYRYTGQEDVCVGTPVANRNRRELEGVIGFLVNTVVIRTEVRGEEGFRELLRRVREAMLGAYAHQEAPFERVVEEVEPERAMSHSPLFQVMFALQNAPQKELTLPELSLSYFSAAHETAKFDLTLSMEEETDGSLNGVFEFSADLFDAATIERMRDHYLALIEAVVEEANADLAIAEIPILTDAERRLLISQRNDAAFDPPSSNCLHQLFQVWAARSPDAIALVYEEQSLSYAELNARANQLAHHLLRLGLEPEGLVALCLDRSVEMVVAILAVLKAGGAYLPLDPAYPQQRLAFMLEDSCARIVLAHSRQLDRLPPRDNLLTLCLDRNWPEVAAESAADLPERADAANLAYVIYTSGSTGRPKGVMIEHRNVTRLLAVTEPLFGFNEGEVWTMFHSYAFDFSVWEIWGALSHGGRLIVPPLWMTRSPQAFLQTLCNEGVTILNQTPSAFRQLVSAARRDAGREVDLRLSLRYVVFGGEALDAASVREWFELYGDERTQLVNMYGITETTVHVTHRALRENDVDQTWRSPIGRSLADLQVYALNERLQPAPLGVCGEIYVGGSGVARGYLRRVALTAERFLPDPFGGKEGGRLYRTGDNGRYAPGGELEYVGRIDDQVKIRGRRIELGEIEAALIEQEGVSECAVVAREDERDSEAGSGSEKTLVAYVVGDKERLPAITELRRGLRQKLPDYMTPQAFVMMDALPLTNNGKVDRRALPAPDRTRPEQEREYVPPRTRLERSLADIWLQTLGVERIGVHDNFFDLGGHSLLAVQAVSRIYDVLNIDLNLRTFFESPTIAALAAVIERERRIEPAKTALTPRSADETFIPLSSAQQRLWFLDQLSPGSAEFNLPVAVRIGGRLDVRTLEKSLNVILERHEALRTTFRADAGRPAQVIAPPRNISLPVVNLEHTSEAERDSVARRMANKEALQPFDLARGPLFRAILFRLSEEDHLGLLTMHHIVSDGWSIGVFMGELAHLYNAFVKGDSPALPDLPIQYADFTLWRQRLMNEGALDSQISYWKRKLADAPVELGAADGRAESSGRPSAGGTQEFALLPDLTECLEAFSRREGVTTFMTLLAAFNVLLHRQTGQIDIVVGTPTANRNRVELERLIGFFINSLVLRTDLSGDPSFRELLSRARDVVLGAFANQDAPFEALVKELRPARVVSRNPLFQAWISFQKAPDVEPELTGLTLSQAPIDSEASVFDISLLLADTPTGLYGAFEYDTGRFSHNTISSMIGHFEYVLRVVTGRPDLRLSEICRLLSVLDQERWGFRAGSLENASLRSLRNIRRSALVVERLRG